MKIFETFKDKKFMVWMLTLSLPIAFQTLVSSLVNTADTIMIGQLGEAEIAAVGIANQVFFILALICFGVNGGCNIFVAQFWGKKDTDNIRRTMSLSVMLSLIPSSLFAVLATVIPDSLMRIFTNDAEVVALGSEYLRIIAYCYIPFAISSTIGSTIRTTERPNLPLVMSIVALFMNITLNYILIFGKLGFAPMGVAGAALATSITRVFEMLIYFSLLYTRFRYISMRMCDFRRSLQRTFVKPFIQSITPVILNETTWGIGVALYSAIYSQMGREVVAAVTIVKTFEGLFSSFFMGMAYAAGVMVGKTVGEHRESAALEYGKRYSLITPIFNIVLGVAMVCLAPLFIGMYNLSEGVRFEAIVMFVILALYSPIRNTNLVLMCGVLRSGGDTKISLFLDLMDVWLIALPLGLICGVLLQWNILIVYAVMMIGEIIKFVVITPRVNRGAWARNVVSNM